MQALDVYNLLQPEAMQLKYSFENNILSFIFNFSSADITQYPLILVLKETLGQDIN